MEYGRAERGLAIVAALAMFASAAAITSESQHAGSTVGAYVDPVLRASLATGAVEPAILVFDPAQQARAWAALADLDLDRHSYDALGMASVVLDATSLDAVAKVPGVATVFRNERMHPLLDKSADYVGAKAVWTTYGATGSGVTILVMDSGIDASHPDLAFHSKVVENVVPSRQGAGLVTGSQEGILTSDRDGHGTHVAGIIAGTGAASDGKFRGIAPDARLIGFEAGLPDPRSGDIEFESLTVLEGFNWALANRAKYDISIVSNSWGANGDFDGRSPVNIATLNLYKAGMLVLFAAGNEGSQGSHSLNKYSVAPWVLSVTAGDYFNQVPSFASRGTNTATSREAYDHPDLVAPGLGITSTRSLHSSLAAAGSTYYATKSGSSMATPHVAGVAALLLEANPRLSPDDLMDLLTATATPMPRERVWEAGAGYVNALKAYQLAARATGHRDAFLSGHVKYAGPASGDVDYSDDAVTIGYLRGHASRLRSPATSVPMFLRSLLTVPGVVTLVGGVTLGVLAFGRTRPPAPSVPRASAARPPQTMPTVRWPSGPAPPVHSASRTRPAILVPPPQRPPATSAQRVEGLQQRPGR